MTRDGMCTVELELSPQAAQSFADAMGKNLGASTVITTNGGEIAARIGSAIPGPKVTQVLAADIKASDFRDDVP